MPEQENPKVGKYNGMRVQRYSYRTAFTRRWIVRFPRELFYTLEKELTVACKVKMLDNHVTFVIDTSEMLDAASLSSSAESALKLSWFDIKGIVVIAFHDSSVFIGLGEKSLLVEDW